MGSIPFAFSVHHFINSVGADAGFASIIGLAILVLLYFAQARETASLREQAYEWAQRVQQLEGRIAQLTRQQAQATAFPAEGAEAGRAAVGARTPAQGAAANARSGAGVASRSLPAAVGVPARVAAPVPAAPAGVGAPALTAATRLIPATGLGSGTAEPEASPASSEQPKDLTAIASPAPATVAGGANGSGHSPAPVGMPAPRVQNAPASPPRIQIRPTPSPTTGRRQPAPLRGGDSRRPSSVGRRVIAGLVVVALLGGVVAAVLLLTRNNGSSSASKPATTARSAQLPRRGAKAGSVAPSSVIVAVLNGTATAQLAHRVAQKLGGLGYKEGTVATAADQTRTATVVAYLPGHRRDALAVAGSLRLGPGSVQAIDQNTQAVACPPSTPCVADVVVTVGSDLANTP